jgi:hypothetical protein
MNRNELERAWPATEPPPGFAERVLEQAQHPPLTEPASQGHGALRAERATLAEWLSARRARWLALPALAVGIAAALLLWLAQPARDGEVLAAEPRIVSIGKRAIAEMENGSHIRWSGDEVWQDRGEVTYRVAPGADFRVQTPHGNVAVLGTVFTVAVAERAATQGESMNKGWVIAGSGATLGALLLVSVEQGSVRLSTGEGALVLGVGQSGTIGSDGVPRLATEEPSAPAKASATPDRDAERARSRQMADAVRRHAARRRAAEAAKQPASARREHQEFRFRRDPSAAAPAPPLSEEEERRRDYIQRTMREQYFPIARDCYQELLERDPKASGKVVLEFAIVGDGDAGVVDRVETRDDENAIDDPEFVMCMRESLYTAVFEPPPPGASETTVVYPVMLEPGE